MSADTVMPLWKGGMRRPGSAILPLGRRPPEIWRWRLEPESTPATPTQAGVVETVGDTAGRIVLVVDGIEHYVDAGQTATFDADRTYRGSGDEPCHLIMTVHLPPTPPSTSAAEAAGPAGQPVADRCPQVTNVSAALNADDQDLSSRTRRFASLPSARAHRVLGAPLRARASG